MMIKAKIVSTKGSAFSTSEGTSAPRICNENPRLRSAPNTSTAIRAGDGLHPAKMTSAKAIPSEAGGYAVLVGGEDAGHQVGAPHARSGPTDHRVDVAGDPDVIAKAKPETIWLTRRVQNPITPPPSIIPSTPRFITPEYSAIIYPRPARGIGVPITTEEASDSRRTESLMTPRPRLIRNGG